LDKAGNSRTVDSTITVDNTPPEIAAISPQNGTQLTGTANITYSATDNIQLASVMFFIDNEQKTISINQVYQWDTSKVTAGNHTIRIVATDSAGNIEEDIIQVRTAHAPLIPIAYIGYASVLILGLAVGALTHWLLLKRKPTRTTTTTPTPTATNT
jgi:hypothetical protein